MFVRRAPAAAWVILAAALVVRIAFFASAHFQASTAIDPLDYERHAVSIAHGHGYPSSPIAGPHSPSAYRPPAYPYFLGALYAVTGFHRDAVRLIQLVLLGLASVALVGVVATRLAGRRAGLAAMALAAVFPPLIAFQSTLLSEALVVPLELAAIAAVLRFRDTRGYRWVGVAGVLAGLLALTRLNMAVLIPVLAAAAWLPPTGGGRRRLTGPALLLAAAALTIAPWTVRNAVVMHRFIPISTQTAFTLAGTYNNFSKHNTVYPGAWVDPRLFSRKLGGAFGGGYDRIFAQHLGEPELDTRLRHAVAQYMRADPGYVGTVTIQNAKRAFELGGPGWERFADPAVGLSPRVAGACAYGFMLFGVLALLGAATRRGRRLPTLVWVGALLTAVGFLVAQGEPRFRVPLDPLVIVLAGIAVAAVLDRRAGAAGERTTRPRASAP
jgi:4-amino-4-deoxy-L-arabinose transferase-like glycosyltransferase